MNVYRCTGWLRLCAFLIAIHVSVPRVTALVGEEQIAFCGAQFLEVLPTQLVSNKLITLQTNSSTDNADGPWHVSATAHTVDALEIGCRPFEQTRDGTLPGITYIRYSSGACVVSWLDMLVCRIVPLPL